jgi:hypothetical protein
MCLLVRRSRRSLQCLLLVCVVSAPFAVLAKADPGTALLETYGAMDGLLRQNQFKRELTVASVETPHQLKGDIFAVVNYPFAIVNAGLNDPNHWCDVMLLHINTKYCHATMASAGTTLRVHVGKKTPEELNTAARLDFSYRVTAVTPEYLNIALAAKTGPMGTSDYRIVLEAVALPRGKTFLHLTYGYSMNFAGRLAVQAYLGTLGSGKVGFTVDGNLPDGLPNFIGGVRGMVERNTMRYYLAIDSFLAASHEAPASQFETRMQSWFTAVEKYPRQLHEMDRSQYLEMKRAENLRQKTVY